jgi:hypothetical protein
MDRRSQAYVNGHAGYGWLLFLLAVGSHEILSRVSGTIFESSSQRVWAPWRLEELHDGWMTIR